MPATAGAAAGPSSSGAHAIGNVAGFEARAPVSPEMPETVLWREPAARASELQEELSSAREQLVGLLLERERLDNRIVCANGQVTLLQGILEELAAACEVESQGHAPSSLADPPPNGALPSISPARVDTPSQRGLEPILARVIVRTVPFAAQAPDGKSRKGQQLRLVLSADSKTPAEQSMTAAHPMSSVSRARGWEVEAEFLGDTYLFSGLGREIAGAGVFVATYQTLPPGTAVELELELPNGPLRALGEVRWARAARDEPEQRPGLGIVFMGPSLEAITSLEEVFRSHSPRYYEV